MDGDLYWYNPAKRLSTNSDIRKPQVLKELLEIEEEHMRWCYEDGFEFPNDCETWIGLIEEEMASVEHVSLRLGIKFGVGDENNVIYQKKVAFWMYCADYCIHIRELPPKVEVEFLSAMTFGANEWTVGHKDTTFPFSEQQCERIVQIYQGLKRLHRKEGGHAYIPSMLSLISETMIVIESRRKNYDYTAKTWTSKAVDIPKPSWKLRALDCVLILFLFGSQVTFRNRLQLVLANRSENISELRELIDSLLMQWGDSNLLASVLVLTNISFLNVLDLSAVQRTASLTSTIFALTSMTIGLHQVWQHRMHLDADIEEQCKYLGQGDVGPDTDARLTAVACCLALPISSLLWCILSFVVALGAFCFQNTNPFGEHVFLAAILGVLGICAFGTSIFFWSKSESVQMKEADREDVVGALGWVKMMAAKTRTHS